MVPLFDQQPYGRNDHMQYKLSKFKAIIQCYMGSIVAQCELPQFCDCFIEPATSCRPVADQSQTGRDASPSPLVTRPKLAGKVGEAVFFNRRTDRRHKVLIKPDIRHGQQHGGEIFAGLDEMVEIGAGIIAGSRT